MSSLLTINSCNCRPIISFTFIWFMNYDYTRIFRLICKRKVIQGKHLYISMIAFFFIGIYGGFINAGIGFVIMLFLHYYNKLNLVKVNATKVVIVLIYTTGAIVTFAMADKINWIYGLVLASGNFLGGWVSSRWSVKRGEKAIKAFLVVMVVLMSVKLWFF